MTGIFRKRFVAHKRRRGVFLSAALSEADLTGTVVENISDTTSGTASLEITLSGAVAESISDTTSGTADLEVNVSGAVAESVSDTTSGTAEIAAATLSGAIVESTADTTSGTADLEVVLSGAVVESGADTTSGTADLEIIVSGAVVESGADTTSGTASVESTERSLSGAVLESISDTTAGTADHEVDVSGAVVESSGDTTSGTIDNPEAAPDARPTGGGVPSKQRSKRRRVVIDGQAFEVPERDLAALIEARLLNRRAPSTAELVAAPVPAKKARRQAKSAPGEAQAPSQAYPSADELLARYEALVTQFSAQAEADMRATLERVAARALAQIEDEEEAVIALLLA